MSLKEEEYYGPKDLFCGNKVLIYGRDCLIYDCDEFTKAWFKDTYIFEYFLATTILRFPFLSKNKNHKKSFSKFLPTLVMELSKIL